jgi:hypothetical protein
MTFGQAVGKQRTDLANFTLEIWQIFRRKLYANELSLGKKIGEIDP